MRMRLVVPFALVWAALASMGNAPGPGCDGRIIDDLDGGATADGGSGADGGHASGPVRYCSERCGSTADCATDYECNADQSCVSISDPPPPACTSDEQCNLIMNSASCTQASDCGAGVCVNHAGLTWCAIQPSSTLPCATYGYSEVTGVDVDGASVTFCLDTKWACKASDGSCYRSCGGDGDCWSESPHCNTATRQCECVTSPTDSCAGNTYWGGTVCVSGQCGCRTGSDCVGATATTCYGGLCGCGSAADCSGNTSSNPGTTWVCEPR